MKVVKFVYKNLGILLISEEQSKIWMNKVALKGANGGSFQTLVWHRYLSLLSLFFHIYTLVYRSPETIVDFSHLWM